MIVTQEILKSLQEALNERWKGNPKEETNEQKGKSPNRGSKRSKPQKAVPVQ